MHGYKEEGTTTTPFDMTVLNELDRFHLLSDVIDRVPKLGERAAYAKQAIREKLIEHKQYIAEHGDDMPEIAGWATVARKPLQRRCGRPRPTISKSWIQGNECLLCQARRRRSGALAASIRA